MIDIEEAIAVYEIMSCKTIYEECALDALKELQEYRKIGTIGEFKNLKGKE